VSSLRRKVEGSVGPADLLEMPAVALDREVVAIEPLNGHELQEVNVDVDRVAVSEVDSLPTRSAQALLSPDGGWS
jgi:hypothetical protein